MSTDKNRQMITDVVAENPIYKLGMDKYKFLKNRVFCSYLCLSVSFHLCSSVVKEIIKEQ